MDQKYTVSWKSKHFDNAVAVAFDEPIDGFEMQDLDEATAMRKADELRAGGDAYAVTVEEQ